MLDMRRVTMYGSAMYEVRVQGQLDKSWITQMSVENVSVISDVEGGSITVLTATVRDQAELRGLLDRIYSLNLPLLSVRTISKQ